MRGIVGLLHRDGRPGSLDDAHGPPGVCGPFAVAYRRDATPTPRPVASAANGILAFDGRLDNRDDLLAITGCDREQPDAVLALALHARVGDEFLSHLNGEFALVLFDARSRSVTLTRDRMGSRPLFHAQAGSTLLFGSTIKSILAYSGVTARPDEDVVAELVVDGFSDARRTCFRNIFSVEAGHAVIVSASRESTRRIWDFDPQRTIRYRAFEDYSAEFASLFRQSVRRRLRTDGPVAVAVSGGLDSSSIFCQAAALRPASSPLGLSWTFPPGSAADERQFLPDLERRAEARIVTLPVAGAMLLATSARLVDAAERPATEWDVRSQLLARARQEGCGVVMDGYFGDHLLASTSYLADFALRGKLATVRRHLRTTGAWATDTDPGVFRRRFRQDLLRALPPGPLLPLLRRGKARWHSRGGSWYRTAFTARALERAIARRTGPPAWSRHAAAIYQLATSGHTTRAVLDDHAAGVMNDVAITHPFRDRDLVAFLMAVPGDVICRDGIPKAILRHAMADVLPESIRSRRWKADFTALGNHALVADFDGITRLLSRDCLAAQAGYVDGARVGASLERMRAALNDSRTAVPARSLAALVGLELWLRRFFGDDGHA